MLSIINSSPTHYKAFVLSLGFVVLITGTLLLTFGGIKYTEDPIADLPYLLSLTLCRETTDSLVFTGSCQPNGTYDASYMQTIELPTNFLSMSVQYEVEFYVTNRVTGNVKLQQGDSQIETTLDELAATPFDKPGGSKVVIYKTSTVLGDGDYGINMSCNDPNTGCDYYPARSLTRYNFDPPKYITLSLDTASAMVISIDQLLLSANVSHTVVSHYTPEFYIYLVKENSKDQTKGIIMCAIGAILLDLLPASIFFGLQAKKQKKKKSKSQSNKR